jgi:hypothetical protein
VSEHRLLKFPTSVYVVVTLGETARKFPVPPGVHEKFCAPDATRVADCPIQSRELVLDAESVGVGLTLTVRAALPVQLPNIPATE